MDIINAYIPEPLNPMFKQGGSFEGWNEDFILICIGIVCLFVLDMTLVRAFSPKSRYFVLHACANIVTIVASSPDVLRALVEPQTAWTGSSYTMIANSAVCAIHIYHCLAFNLGFSDIMHHVIFVVVLCGCGIYFKQIAGTANNYGCFFLSGLPGGLDYIWLILKIEGVIPKMTEKRWNRHVQQWVRGPSMSIYAFIAFTSWYSGNTQHIPIAAVIVVATLHFVNGIYYADEAVGSFYTWAERERAAKTN
eukprot:m.115795 g.115795  ORF g.115795 m.115795 type:complete len:250 (-) comp28448_c0_seq1:96-845(-)